MSDTSPKEAQTAPLSVADLAECNWDKLFCNDVQADLHECLIAGARDAETAGHSRQAAALRLLADACSLMLDSDNSAQPFRPWWVGADGRSTPTMASFGPDTVALFADVAAQTTQPELTARLADIVWIREPSRGLSFADRAIEAYLSAPLEGQGWKLDGREAWLRATYLALSLRRTKLVAVIEERLKKAFWREPQEDSAAVTWYAALMFRHGLAVEDHPKIVERLAELGSELASLGRFREARDLFGVAAGWLHRKGPKQREAEMIAAIAQAWYDEAQAALAPPSTSALAAGDAIEKAIQVYRTIPRKFRPALGVDERITTLQLERLEAGARSLAELGTVSTQPTDISELVRESIAHVVGKDEIGALHGLATVWPGPKVDELERNAREIMDGSLFRRLFRSRTTMAADGRVISKVSGRDAKEDEARGLMVQMLEHFRLERQLGVQGCILPALDHIAVEHPLNLDDFVTLARNSRVVPPDHAQRIGRALYFGYRRDFETALQYLAAEMESIARYHLKGAGAVTINTDKEGIQMELGLSTLVRIPEMESVFGKDLTFEIKAVFADQDGANLRNDVAHGLIPDEGGNSVDSVYAWWFVFRITFLMSPYTKATTSQNLPPNVPLK
jgi:tetratricopeptide (TPR) repeat protein